MLNWLKKFFEAILRWLGIIAEPVQPPEPEVPIPPRVIVKPIYKKSKSLMTYQERKFYWGVLLKQLGRDYAILPKVRLGDLIYLANDPTDKKLHNNRIQCKHIDFVICDRKSFEPLVALELDDSSHSNFDRHESDVIKDLVCANAGLYLLRVKVAYSYDAPSIANSVREYAEKALNMPSPVSPDQDTKATE